MGAFRASMFSGFLCFKKLVSFYLCFFCRPLPPFPLPSFSLLPSPFSLLPSPFSLLPSPFSPLPLPLPPSPFSLLPSRKRRAIWRPKDLSEGMCLGTFQGILSSLDEPPTKPGSTSGETSFLGGTLLGLLVG